MSSSTSMSMTSKIACAAGTFGSAACRGDYVVMGTTPTARWSDPLEEYVTPLREALRRDRWG